MSHTEFKKNQYSTAQHDHGIERENGVQENVLYMT